MRNLRSRSDHTQGVEEKLHADQAGVNSKSQLKLTPLAILISKLKG